MDIRAVYVICPYFRCFYSGSETLCCEGAESGMESLRRFDDASQLERWTGCLCNTYQYMKCPVARTAAKKYGEMAA